MVNGRALLALVLQLAFLAAGSGWRTTVHRRRTGDSGFRWQRHDRVARVSGALFAAAIVVGTINVTLAAFSVTELWGQLDGGAAAAFMTAWIVFFAGCVVTLVAQSEMGVSWRIGVDPSERTRLVTNGLFGWARNPIFTGMVAAAVGLALFAPTPRTAVSVVLLVVAAQVQVRRVEEPCLRDAMPGWPMYAQRVVGRFVPRLGKISR